MAAPDFLSVGAASGLIPGSSIFDEAIGVAVEHCLWAEAQDLSPLEIMLQLYSTVGWRIPSDPGWDHALWYLAATWLELQKKISRARGRQSNIGRGRPMSRIRSVHPSQWTEGEFAQCSPLARLLLLGLRNEADDHGIFEWQALTLKLRVLPLDDVDVDELLGELAARGLIASYEAGGQRYGICRSWHQQPQHPSYRYPQPPVDDYGRTPEPSGGLTESDPGESRDPTKNSVSPHSDSYLNGKEGKKRERGARATAPGGAALSLNFDLPDDWREEAAATRQVARLPEVNLAAEWAKFKIHQGETRRRLDVWRRRWLNWALNARAAPGNGAVASEPAQVASNPRRRDELWGRDADWWQQFAVAGRLHAAAWVDGHWRTSWGRPPDDPQCGLERELVAAAIAERARRLREQPELVMPLAGGAATHPEREVADDEPDAEVA